MPQEIATTELAIHPNTTHGTEGVVNVIIKEEKGNPVAFCNAYRFASGSGTKIESGMSYAIELPSGG